MGCIEGGLERGGIGAVTVCFVDGSQQAWNWWVLEGMSGLLSRKEIFAITHILVSFVSKRSGVEKQRVLGGAFMTLKRLCPPPQSIPSACALTIDT